MTPPSPRLIGMFVVGAIVLGVTGIVIFASGDLFARTYPFVVYFETSVAGLDRGSPVKFKGVQVGAVREVLLTIGGGAERLNEIKIPVIIELNENRILERGAAIDLASQEVRQAYLDAGLRAQLGVESFVTGRKFVALDFYPESPITVVNDATVPFAEIPTVRTGFEELQEKLQGVLVKLTEVDVDTLIASVTNTFLSLDDVVSIQLRAVADSLPGTIANLNTTLRLVQKLATGLDTTVVPLRQDMEQMLAETAEAMSDMRGTLREVRAVVDPASPLFVQLDQTLTSLSAAARAFETFAEYLSRNPSAILRGKPEREPN